MKRAVNKAPETTESRLQRVDEHIKHARETGQPWKLCPLWEMACIAGKCMWWFDSAGGECAMVLAGAQAYNTYLKDKLANLKEEIK